MEIVPQAILLDANLLILQIIGVFDDRLLGRKRLDIYDEADFKLLNRIVGKFVRNLTTPHLLAEASNLTDQIVSKPRHREFRKFLAAQILPFLDEQWCLASQLCSTEPFFRLGLADAAICQLADDRTLVLTVDAELYNVLIERGVNAQNFNHLRDD
jgi:hypothetical protein